MTIKRALHVAYEIGTYVFWVAVLISFIGFGLVCGGPAPWVEPQ